MELALTVHHWLFVAFASCRARHPPCCEVSSGLCTSSDAPKAPLRPNGQPRAKGTRLGNERVKGQDRIEFPSSCEQGRTVKGWNKGECSESWSMLQPSCNRSCSHRSQVAKCHSGMGKVWRMKGCTKGMRSQLHDAQRVEKSRVKAGTKSRKCTRMQLQVAKS